MAAHNPHYDKLIKGLTEGKDSIFEPCKIVEYQPEKLTARVFFLNSKQHKDDVLVLFPSLFLNTGIIAPPVKDSTALAFWGADKVPYVLPAQFILPKMNPKNGITKPNASPGQIDRSFDLSNVESGEVLLRCLGGSFIHLKNFGEIELGTPKLHRLSLFEHDGKLETSVERTDSLISGYSSYNGPYVTSEHVETNDHHIKIELDDKTPDWSVVGDADDKLLLQNLSNEVLSEEYLTSNPIWFFQMGNVFDNNDSKVTSSVDGAELFMKADLKDKAGNLRSTTEISKNGSFLHSVKNGGEETIIEVDSNTASVKANGTEMHIGDGDITYKLGGKAYSMNEIISRINQLSAAHNISPLG